MNAQLLQNPGVRSTYEHLMRSYGQAVATEYLKVMDSEPPKVVWRRENDWQARFCQLLKKHGSLTVPETCGRLNLSSQAQRHVAHNTYRALIAKGVVCRAKDRNLWRYRLTGEDESV
ncbi:hypothetical protein GS597_01325 [Synechococcales cyanobacterium C]|uniref:Uncharacterized protein n=1 Tax=Petrachloros mirabilis ULC683 TaxID=2781853 RepID=A0A8K2A6H5_9CYAN|nr:hypothetical protein [Petrachloros mirabilis]NCJ05180.1 hypothetical protein [Petrachloros mirabilis ULC683]